MNKKLPLLALLTAFPPLATDMYLPAIPTLQKQWNQPLSVINLTLVCFFIAYCISLLVYGPVSDRYGRRPPLMAGIGLYILACILCALSPNAESLIVSRIIQAAGAAAAATLAMAISKDLFTGKEREQILAVIAVIVSLAPMLAPVLGGWLLKWFSWPWIFVSQAILGAISLAGVYKMEETLKNPIKVKVSELASGYIYLFKNVKFMGYAIMVAIAAFPLFAFIGGSADIYITRLGLTEQTFGYFFGANALAFMAGSFSCSRLLRVMSSKHLMTAGFIGILTGGLWMLLFAGHGPYSLALPMALLTFSIGLSRPPSNNLVLEQVDKNAGAASSIMIFSYFIFGAISMWMISLDWENKIRTIGVVSLVAGCLMLGMWITLQRISANKKVSSL
ncbi:multidrug effflux MFS transporter [Desulforegula conservatrix]|uniref:multidrug effflux MFS transporter n=1 Tax=Desulforegula conservatrix TaxID=153026 RepID=UPI000405A419|nr:multidrug effflux MFS transporter [Desulforegula conservatrix]